MKIPHRNFPLSIDSLIFSVICINAFGVQTKNPKTKPPKTKPPKKKPKTPPPPRQKKPPPPRQKKNPKTTPPPPPRQTRQKMLTSANKSQCQNVCYMLVYMFAIFGQRSPTQSEI